MVRKPQPVTIETQEVRNDGLYEITVSVPFEYKRVHFVPDPSRTYTIKGALLAEIKDKVSEYRRVS